MKNDQSPSDLVRAIPEEDYLPISAIQHYLFCPRQCGLIHIEQIWEENRLTVEGRNLHEKVHEAGHENRRDIRFAFGLNIRSRRFGLSGKADLVEFHLDVNGDWQPYPVEYKRGHHKVDDCDRIQLCAQAICLEEMINTTISEGAIFYGQPRKREIVVFSPILRIHLEETIFKLRALLASGQTPPGSIERHCSSCSLITICLPHLSPQMNSVNVYLDQELDQIEKIA